MFEPALVNSQQPSVANALREAALCLDQRHREVMKHKEWCLPSIIFDSWRIAQSKLAKIARFDQCGQLARGLKLQSLSVVLARS